MKNLTTVTNEGKRQKVADSLKAKLAVGSPNMLLTAEEVSLMVGHSVKGLTCDVHVPRIQTGLRSFRYKLCDVEAWIASKPRA